MSEDIYEGTTRCCKCGRRTFVSPCIACEPPLSNPQPKEVNATGPIPADAATPRTDAIRKIASIEDRYLPLLELSGRLERELAQTLKERDEANAHIKAMLSGRPNPITELRAQLAAVTQDRDNLAAAYAFADSALATATQERDKAIRDYSDIFSVAKTVVEDDPDHNPDSLTPEQVGAADGWRLLKQSEVEFWKGFWIPKTEWFSGFDKKWITSDDGEWVAGPLDTLRTRLSPAELAALRAKGSE